LKNLIELLSLLQKRMTYLNELEIIWMKASMASVRKGGEEERERERENYEDDRTQDFRSVEYVAGLPFHSLVHSRAA
jgi:hypothetical protein